MSTASFPRRALLPAACVLAALGAGIALGAYWLAPESPSGTQPAATVLEQPRPLPEFRLADQDGRPFDRERLAGNWHLLFFGFTHCPDVCPTTLGRLAAVEARLADSPHRPQIVFVSVDPKRDDPDTVGRYVKYFDPDFVGVTGPLDQIRRLTDALYLPFAYRGDTGGDYSVDHSAALVLIDPAARARAYFTAPHDPAGIAADLRKILAAS